MSRADQLRANIQANAAELYEIERAEKIKKAQALVGRCYRFRNNYSCPEKPEDYWHGYVLVTKIDEHGAPHAMRFEIDSKGKFTIIPEEFVYSVERYTAITPAEFREAVVDLHRKIRELLNKTLEGI